MCKYKCRFLLTVTLIESIVFAKLQIYVSSPHVALKERLTLSGQIMCYENLGNAGWFFFLPNSLTFLMFNRQMSNSFREKSTSYN